MRTTVTLADDVAAAVDRLRRERSIGVSEAVNELVRDGLVRRQARQRFVQATHDLGTGVDYTNVAEALETLDGPAAR
jgi:metal-responsive CopG/Arc/MetJ family transcriptional regulator